jgi:diguanylate cyclase (GGDEF)-like protein/PAS domain S-box-containing protein
MAQSSVVKQKNDLAWDKRVIALLPFILLAPTYYLAAKLGLLLAIEHPSATPFWPPTGIAIASLVILGNRAWPLIFAGAFLANHTTAGNVWSSLGIATGNTLEAVVAAMMITKFANGRHAFDRPIDACKFVFLGAILCTAISATIGVLSLFLTGYLDWYSTMRTLVTWWLGDATGAIVFGPPIIVWSTHRVFKWNRWRALEAGLLFLALLAVVILIFRQPLAPDDGSLAQGFFVFPIACWIAFRFYPRVTTTATLIIATVVLAYSIIGLGPFSIYDAQAWRLLVSQLYICVLGITMIVLSSATYEKMRIDEKVRESEERFRLLADSSPSMIWVTDSDGNCTFLNRTWRQYTGRALEDGLGEGWTDDVHSDDVCTLKAAYRHAATHHCEFRADFRVRGADQVYRWFLSTGNPRFNSDGRFSGHVGTCLDISDRKEHEERLKLDALRDPLTGLPNRTFFIQHLRESLEDSWRGNEKLRAVLFLDLDRFKLINDTFGHPAGDRLLIDISRRLETIIRPGDTIARLSGDEFAILLEGIDGIAQAESVANRLEEIFNSPFKFDDETFYVSFSTGIAIVGPHHSRPEDVLRDADSAMYKAKSLGRRRHQVFEAESDKPVVEVLLIEAELRRALDAGNLEILYQPIYALPEGPLSGFEALVRWPHPRRGQLLPADFVSIAEQTGLILDLDRFVMRQACRQLAEWQRIGAITGKITVSVNVSAMLFSRLDMVETVRKVVVDSGIAPQTLKLEITETVLMEDKVKVMNALKEIRKLGVGIALDDFGTGFSGLDSLASLPLNAVKIDRSFVASLSSNINAQTVVRKIVELAHDLGMTVTAEGIETIEEKELVTRLKCDKAQGHFFGEPVTAQQARMIVNLAATGQ